MPNKKILLILSDHETAKLLEQAALTPAGYQVTTVFDRSSAKDALQQVHPDLVITSDLLEGRDTLDLINPLLNRYPPLPVILMPAKHSDALAIDALRKGFADYLKPPVRTIDVLQSVDRTVKRQNWLHDWVRLEAKRDTKSLRERIDGMETIQSIGRQVTSLLDLDNVLTAVVDAAVELTKAEEGSLLLLDENTGELYIRAGRNFQEDFVSTFRLPIRDSLAGQVIRTGKPVIIDEKTPQKIKTSYLVHTIVYVPLIVHERVIGVLEVDNRQSGKPFSDYHVTLVSALADYAAIAIENARLYSHSEVERNKLETILTKIEDAVIVVDNEQRIILVNRKAREAFDITENNITAKRLREVVHHQELIDTVRRAPQTPLRVEIRLDDGRVLNTQLTPIPEIGLVLNMQDITHLKELDRIKSDFVNTVSHDLRSPLTAILGYIELISRVGPVNKQQQEFVRRVQLSVNNITALINDLLELGRIEAGFDTRKEIVPISAIINYAVDGLKNNIEEKSQELTLDFPEDLPSVLGNPVQLRQVLTNLITNANIYTQQGGKIAVYARSESEQIIIQIIDSGPGIPPTDQPYIFDKFYRASNTPADIPGTGLGLAIVKSIVDSHLGRIWVESTPEEGTTFTVVLPIIDNEL